MSIYWLMVVAVIGLGLVMPQHSYLRRWYIIIMAVIHTFVCGFRYMYLTGDLRKYASVYYSIGESGWFSEEVFNGGRNAGFSWLMKLISSVTGGNFQAFLFVLAIISQIILAVVIYRYSPKPWLSYLVYDCFGYYIFGFSAIKQALAMSVIMLALMAIFEKKPIKFLVFTLLAGFVHMPALILLPAYFLANRKINGILLLGYVVSAGVIYAFRTRIIDFATDFYYEEETFQLTSRTLGGRFLVMVIILIAGLLLKGFHEKNYERIFNLIVAGAVLQMFSSFDNVFTRLADYYLQFLVLFIPMIFYSAIRKTEINHDAKQPLLPFNDRSIRILVILLVVILIWWYYTTCLNVNIENAVDDYTNFRFMWDVI